MHLRAFSPPHIFDHKYSVVNTKDAALCAEWICEVGWRANFERLRKQKGFTQEKFAEASGFTQQYISGLRTRASQSDYRYTV